MFSIGNYKVRFQHKHDEFIGLDGKEIDDICGETTCILLDNETNKSLAEFTAICRKGNNNSKNYRRKFTLATILQGFFPTNLDNPHKSSWNKKARALFWQAYAEKRGGLEDKINRDEIEDKRFFEAIQNLVRSTM